MSAIFLRSYEFGIGRHIWDVQFDQLENGFRVRVYFIVTSNEPFRLKKY